MSVHDHHNDPNDPVNQPPKRGTSRLDPVDRNTIRNEGRVRGGAPTWMLGLLALVLIGGIIYAMSDRTSTQSNTGSPPAASTSATPNTTGSESNPATNPPTTSGQK